MDTQRSQGSYNTRKYDNPRKRFNNKIPNSNTKGSAQRNDNIEYLRDAQEEYMNNRK